MNPSNLDIENLYYHLAKEFDYRCDHDVAQEYDWITSQLESHGSPLHFDTLVARIQMNYAGRGPMFEVPTRHSIVVGVRKLLRNDLINVNGDIKFVKNPPKKLPKRTAMKIKKTTRKAELAKKNRSTFKSMKKSVKKSSKGKRR